MRYVDEGAVFQKNTDKGMLPCTYNMFRPVMMLQMTANQFLNLWSLCNNTPWYECFVTSGTPRYYVHKYVYIYVYIYISIDTDVCTHICTPDALDALF